MATVAACRVCGLVQRLDEAVPDMAQACCRCGANFGADSARGASDATAGAVAETTAALSLAALVLYVPANLLPILVMDMHGAHSASTIWDGCASLFRAGQWPVAAIVFLSSILIPLLKLLGLFLLVTTARAGSTRWQRERIRIYRIISAVGSWAMLDVFLMAVLVALVKLQQLASIRPGPALPAFAAVVTLTILASARFDPALIWPRRG